MERMATKKTQRLTIWEFVLLHRRINLYWREKRAHYFILVLRKIKRPKIRKNLCSNKTTALCEKNNLIIMTFLVFFSVQWYFFVGSHLYFSGNGKKWKLERFSAAFEVIYLVTHLFLLSCIIFRQKVISEGFMASDPIRGFYGSASTPCHFCISLQ